MFERKVFCEMISGIVYEDRCLYSLCKVIDGNQTCESCVVREIEKLKAQKTEKPVRIKKARRKTKRILDAPENKDVKYIGAINAIDTIHVINTIHDINISPDDLEQTLNVRQAGEILGLSRRRIQEMAKKGKIPACKSGQAWVFDKKVVEDLVSGRKGLELKTEDPGEGPGETSNSPGIEADPEEDPPAPEGLPDEGKSP